MLNSRLRVLCASSANCGHAIPVLTLALRLRESGHEIVMASPHGEGDRIDHLSERRGIPTMPMPNATLQDFLAVVPMLEQCLPDVTLNDGAPEMWMALAAWRPACRVSVMRFEQFLGYERRNLFLQDKYGLESDDYLDRINTALTRHGLRPVADARELCAADIVVVPSVPQIDPLPERMLEFFPDTTFIYTGPLLLPDAGQIPQALQEWLLLNRRRGTPIVLITLGTVWGARVYRMLVDCFAAGEFAVVMVVTQERERQYLEQLHQPWLRVSAFTDLLTLARSVDLIIHHCGHGTLGVALLAGKPSLTLPSGEYDREDNALRLEDLDCGRHLGHDFFRHGINRRAMIEAVTDVLGRSAIRRGVEGMSRVMNDYVQTRGAGALEKALAQHFAKSKTAAVSSAAR